MRLLPLVLAVPLGTAAVGAASALAAQTPPTPGAQVRVWSPELPRRPQAAVLGAWGLDSLELHAPLRRGGEGLTLGPEPAWVITRQSVTRLDVLVPRSRGEGARYHGLIGAASGALAGVALGALAAGLGGEYYPRGTDQPGVPVFFLSVPLGAAFGGALGGLWGAALPGRYWRTVPLPVLLRVSPVGPAG